MSQVPPTFIADWILLKIFLLFLEIMASHMVTSYGAQAAQANEEPPSKSSLDLTLTQHPCDEKPEPREVRARFEVEPPRTRYYHIPPNSCTLDEPETVCEGCYKTKDTFIFAWSSVPSVGHYRWFRGLIRRLPLNNKADYLVHTIRRILNFL
jgi:hypothetical protein